MTKFYVTLRFTETEVHTAADIEIDAPDAATAIGIAKTLSTEGKLKWEVSGSVPAVIDYEAEVTTATPPYGTLAHEFPDFDRATLPAIPAGFFPAHWHNDICPHWQFGENHETANPTLWIDYADPARREMPDGKRFTLHWRINPPTDNAELCLEWTDDWSQILATLEHLEARVIASRWVDRFHLGFHPDTRGRDYVLPNMVRCLTDAEADAYDADVERLFSLPGDPYQHGLDAMRAAGLLRPGEG